MKRIFFVAVTAVALLAPALASAQGWVTVYHPGNRGVVAVPAAQTPATPAPAIAKTPFTPQEIIARHVPMARGYLANANDRGGVQRVAAAHCERLIAQARADLARNQ